MHGVQCHHRTRPYGSWIRICSSHAGDKNVALELSGQVNRGLLITNDGNDTDFFNVDNDNSSTRFRLVGEYKNYGITVGARIEVQVESNSSSDVNQDNKRDDDSDFFGLRKAEVWFDTAYGRLWLARAPRRPMARQKLIYPVPT